MLHTGDEALKKSNKDQSLLVVLYPLRWESAEQG